MSDKLANIEAKIDAVMERLEAETKPGAEWITRYQAMEQFGITDSLLRQVCEKHPVKRPGYGKAYHAERLQRALEAECDCATVVVPRKGKRPSTRSSKLNSLLVFATVGALTIPLFPRTNPTYRGPTVASLSVRVHPHEATASGRVSRECS